MHKIFIINLFLFITYNQAHARFNCFGGGSVTEIGSTSNSRTWHFIRGGEGTCDSFMEASDAQKLDLFAQGNCQAGIGGIENYTCVDFTGQKDSRGVGLKNVHGCRDLGDNRFDVWGELQCSTLPTSNGNGGGKVINSFGRKLK